MTLPPGVCPGCGGAQVPPHPLVTTRTCPQGAAVIVDGHTVAHLGPAAAVALADELNQRAAIEDPFTWGGPPAAERQAA